MMSRWNQLQEGRSQMAVDSHHIVKEELQSHLFRCCSHVEGWPCYSTPGIIISGTGPGITTNRVVHLAIPTSEPSNGTGSVKQPKHSHCYWQHLSEVYVSWQRLLEMSLRLRGAVISPSPISFGGIMHYRGTSVGSCPIASSNLSLSTIQY